MTALSPYQSRLLRQAREPQSAGLGVHQVCFPAGDLAEASLREGVSRALERHPALVLGVRWSGGGPSWAPGAHGPGLVHAAGVAEGGVEAVLAEDRRQVSLAAPGGGFRFTLLDDGDDGRLLVFTYARALFDRQAASDLLDSVAAAPGVDGNEGSGDPAAGRTPGAACARDEAAASWAALVGDAELPTPLPLARAQPPRPTARTLPSGSVVRALGSGPGRLWWGSDRAEPDLARRLEAAWSVVLRRLTGRSCVLFLSEVPGSEQRDSGSGMREVALVAGASHRELTIDQLGAALGEQVASAGDDPEAARDAIGLSHRRPLSESVVAVEAGGLHWTSPSGSVPPRWERSWMPVPLRVVLTTTGAAGALRLEYDPGRLDATSAERLVEIVAGLLEAGGGGEVPALELPILGPAALKRVRTLARGAAWAGEPKGFLASVQERIRAHPEANALVSASGGLTYAQLEHASAALAEALRARGIGPDSRVGIQAERTPEVMVAVLATLRAGGAYVPLDPAYPGERIAYMLEDSGAELVLGREERFAAGVDWMALPSLAALLGAQGAPVPARWEDGAGDDLAYVIYTSGSTGRPKGVAMVRRALSNLVEWQCAASAMGPGDRTLQFASLSFDVSFQELFATWASAGTLVLVDEATRSNPVAFLEYLRDEQIARLFLPFVALQQLTEAARFKEILPEALREVFVAGEQLRITEAVREFFQALPDCFLENQYGPAESHVVTSHRLAGDPRTWPVLPPIGLPIPRTEVLLLDPWGHPVPVGGTGELYIGGIALARGYLGRPELTTRRFLAGTWAPAAAGGRRYRTGDLGTLGSDGVIGFVGRADEQIKIRGFRVEPGEVEDVLERHAAVQAAAVVARSDSGGSNMLVAYVQTAGELSGGELRDLCLAHLPGHMVPSRFAIVTSFPLTPSGKIDRRALAARELTEPAAARSAPADLDLTGKIAAVWGRVLELDHVPLDRSFFELGGTSVLTLRLAVALGELLGREVPVTALFEHPTVRRLARHLGAGDGSPAEPGEGHRSASRLAAPIAVVGMDCRLPGAADVEEFWHNLVAGSDGIRHFTREELEAAGVDARQLDDPDYVRARGIMDEAVCFDAAFFGYSPREARLMDPQQRVFLESCWKALESAGYAPDELPGPAGVWGGTSTGMGYTTYLLSNLASGGTLEDSERLPIMLGNACDYLTTRVSYKFGLRGPSVNVQTACSTSLVAVCHAVESLRRGECDFALAGGVSIAFPQRTGYLHEEGGIESSDGRCRPFDAGAEGTVFSDGVATVVLRKLEDALEAGDPVHAVIRGIGINNDGADKVSFSAPSVEGQAAAIGAAQEQAGFPVDSIGYVEAHGTATQLGDPIEIAALTRAFRRGTDRSGFCAVGSVKSNIGHTVAAAGAAALIKTTLALERGVIPANVHFEKPNDRIDFGKSPFFVAGERIDWPPGTRRAGVSSFGLGGTNAHVVLEQAPERPPSSPGREYDLTVLSAAADEPLAAGAHALAGAYRSLDGADWPDAAHTTRVGRSAMKCRMAVVAPGPTSAADLLAGGRDPAKIVGEAPETAPAVAFLFPGGGAQYPGMARDLYRKEPVFRAAIDRCASELGSQVDLLAFLLDSDEDRWDMERPGLALPTLFSVEYALAQLWLSWGVQPSALLGHSMGEYTAACLAGVMAVEDAIALVVTRGRLFETLEEGAMTAVPLAEEAILPELTPELSLAVVNGPHSCVVSGPSAAVSAFEARMDAKDADCRRVRIAVAAHSRMLEPILAPFRAAFARIDLRPPSIPCLSNVTGTWLTDDEATSPAYWVRQLRQTVRFSDGLHALSKLGALAMVEVGPGRTLSSLAKLHPASGNSLIVTSLRHAREAVDDQAFLLRSLGELWVGGVAVDWWRFVDGQSRRRVRLPGYRFRRDRFVVEPAPLAPPAPAPGAGGTPDWVSLLQQQLAVLQPRAGAGIPPTARPVVRADPTPAGPPSEPEPPSRGPRRSDVTRRERILFKLKEVVQDLSGVEPGDLPEDTSFLDLGFDSLFLTQASLGFKREFGVRVTFRQLFEEAPNLSALAEYIDGQLAPEAEVPGPAPEEAAPAGPVAAGTAAPEVPPVTAGPAPAPPPALPAGGADIQQLLALQLQSTAAILAALAGGGAVSGAGAAPAGPAPGAVPAAAPPAAPAEKAGEPAAPEAEAPASAPKPAVRSGPFREIDRERVAGLSDRQRAFVGAFAQRYLERTRKSRDLTEAHRDVFADPRAVAGFRKDWKEIVYPIAVDRSKGSRMWDIDGNEYVDAVSGFGAIFFGHAPDFVVEAVDRQLHHSLDYGPQSTIAGEVARMVCEITGMERVSFCNTGSEAVLAAMRTARTATGNDTIVTFNGDYHGIFDEVLVRRQVIGSKTRNVPVAPGIPGSSSQNMVVLDYGEPGALEEIRKLGDRLAGVLVEPVQSRTPELQPREFLRSLRRLCTELEVPLIFDEIITGFRVHPRGAQGWFGVQADIAAYGKVIGGGMPIGVVAGKKLYMDALDGGTWRYGDDSFPEAGVTYFAGTFIRHPLSLTAVHAVLKHLEGTRGALQDRANARTARLCVELNDWFEARRLPIHLVHFGSVFLPRFGGPPEFDAIFHRLLHYHGLHLWEGRPGFLTTEHSEADIDRMIRAFQHAAEEMVDGGLLQPIAGEASEASRPRRVELTQPQTELWLAAQMGDAGSRAFNEPVRFDFRGKVHVPALRRALRQVVARHESLRTTVCQDTPGLFIHETMDVPLGEVDLTGLAAADREGELERHLDEESSRAFDLAEGPLVRARLIRLGPADSVFILTGHHIACDGWSIEIALRDLATFYNAAVTGRSLAMADAMQLTAYNEWYHERQKDPEIRTMEAYWIDRFRDTPPVLELPTDHPRPPQKTYNGARHAVHVRPELGERIKALGAEAGCTLFTTLLGAFNVLLYRLSGQEDLVVGVPSAGQALLGENTLVAHCVSFLPIRSRIDPDVPFCDYLRELRGVTMDANDHQEYTYGALVEKLRLPRDPSRVPLVSASFNLDPAIVGLEFHGLDLEYVPAPRSFSKLDLDLNIIEIDGALLLEVDHNTDLIDARTALRWMDHYVTLLEAFAEDGSRPIGSVDLVTAREQTALIAGTAIEPSLPPATRVEELFLRRVAEMPDAVAIECSGRTVTYGELEALSGRIAAGLAGQLEGVDEPIVGVLLERTPELVATLLGIWRAGAAYLPLDPEFPPARLQRVVEDARPSCIVTTPALRSLAGRVSDSRFLSELLESRGTLPAPVAPSELAYAIYTSGSTGRPKGVEIPHAAVVEFLRSMAVAPGMTAEDGLLAVTTISFDISVLELFLPLAVGGRLILAPQATARDGVALAELLETSRATIMQATPTHWELLCESGWAGAGGLVMLAGGEALPQALADRLLDAGGMLWNMYGPTETTIWSTCHRVRPSSDPAGGVRIGRPIRGTRVYVLDGELRPVAPGVPGELFIGGAGLARGYRGRPDLTAERFLEPAASPAGERLYRTGDVVRYRADGELQFLGRSDRQVKVRGFRLELGEVEAALDSQPGVTRAFAAVFRRGGGDTRLAAYFTGSESIAGADLREALRATLPDYMVPQAFVRLERFPLTANGKVDAGALPDPFTEVAVASNGVVAWSTPLEEQVAAVWREILGTSQFGRNDDFFDLGGHSVLAARVIGRLRTSLAGDLGLRDLFAHPTVAALAARIEALRADGGTADSVPSPDTEEFVL